MRSAANFEKLRQNLDRCQIKEKGALIKAIDDLGNEYIRFAWDLRNLVLLKDMPLDLAMFEAAIERMKRTDDVRSFFAETKRTSKRQ